MGIEKIAEYDTGGLYQTNAVEEINKRKLPMVSNLQADMLLQSDNWRDYIKTSPFWTGTLIASRKDNKPFEEILKFDKLTFNVPEKFQGETGAILCNHPDFTLKENVYTPGKSARLIAFPEENGWYHPEKEFGVPNGKASNSDDPAARWIYRRTDMDYTGLLVRRCDSDGYGRRVVGAYDRPYDGRLGVLGVRGKFSVPKHVHEWKCECGAKRV